MDNKNKFITFEGIDGAGKSTVISLFAEFLRSKGQDVLAVREPGGTGIGEDVRHIFLNYSMDGISELLLLFAARRALVNDIRAALDKGQWVLCDRFVDSSFAYQGGGKGAPINFIELLEKNTLGNLVPDKTILLDLPVDVAAKRLESKGKNRFDAAPPDFMQSVRDAFLARAKQDPARFIIIDATKELSEVGKEIENYLAALFVA